MVRCSVLGCRSNSDRKLPNLSFHSFPHPYELQSHWIKATGRKNWIPKPSSKVCSHHFEERFLVRKTRQIYLSPEAVPVLRLNTYNASPSAETTFMTFLQQDPSEYGDVNVHCRGCLQPMGHGRFNLFEPWPGTLMRSDALLAHDLAALTNIQIYEEDSHPKAICFKCFKKFKEAILFIAMVKNSDYALNKISVQNHSKSKSNASNNINKYDFKNLLGANNIEFIEVNTDEIDLTQDEELDIKDEIKEEVAETQIAERDNEISDVERELDAEVKQEVISLQGEEISYSETEAIQEIMVKEEEEEFEDMKTDIMDIEIGPEQIISSRYPNYLTRLQLFDIWRTLDGSHIERARHIYHTLLNMMPHETVDTVRLRNKVDIICEKFNVMLEKFPTREEMIKGYEKWLKCPFNYNLYVQPKIEEMESNASELRIPLNLGSSSIAGETNIHQKALALTNTLKKQESNRFNNNKFIAILQFQDLFEEILVDETYWCLMHQIK